mmetsp:Transcript_32773/g.76595  ORF Transcript_32773/g.76595 Transcript_32773/m.76595 type:complete len:110 (+) Transcript_32773:245-574(+)
MQGPAAFITTASSKISFVESNGLSDHVRGTVSFEQKNGSHAAGSSADEFRKSEGKSYVSKITTAQGSNPSRRHNTSWGEHTKTGCSFRDQTNTCSNIARGEAASGCKCG